MNVRVWGPYFGPLHAMETNAKNGAHRAINAKTFCMSKVTDDC